MYVARTKTEYNWSYKPVASLGFDTNETDDAFLVFSDNFSTIKQPSKTLIEKIDECTKQRNNKELKSSQRRHFNNKAKTLHNKLKNSYKPLIDAIVNYVEKNKYCLCIDDVKTGKGTFGSGQIINLLKTQCENKHIPFELVPTPYTSQTCHSCGNVDKDARKSVDMYVCDNPLCKEYLKKQNAHKNAAIVISQKGWSSYSSKP